MIIDLLKDRHTSNLIKGANTGKEDNKYVYNFLGEN